MKQKSTELVMILDRSGSMSGLERDTVGGYNSMLEQQKWEAGECRVTTVLFDHRYELIHDRIDLRGIEPIRPEQYQVGGSTALLDAIGQTIEKIVSVQKHTAPQYRADRVLFVIITDGEENASRRYSAGQIRAMIRQQKLEFGWEFLFLGANIDAVETAGRFGIDADRAADYVADGAGTRLNFEVMSQVVSSIRSCGAVPQECLSAIRADQKKRKSRR